MRRLLCGVMTLTIAVGCGGEDTIPLAEYVERADAICRENNTRGQAELDELRKRLEADGELDLDETVELNRKALEILRPGLERLEELPPPEERSDAAETYVRASRDANEAFADVVEAQEDGDTERFRDAKARNEEHVRQTREAAAELGLEECGAR